MLLKPLLETLISLPLVLPPTVIGFYFLWTLGLNSTLGHYLYQTFNIQLVFSFPGLVIASIIYSMPFMVHPIYTAFKSIPNTYLENCFLMNKTWFQKLWHVLLPNIQPALLSGFVLTFAHTIGEFGIVLMIGGNIPGQTELASTILYTYVESMQYQLAHQHALLLLLISVTILFLVYIINSKKLKTFF